jgi:multicomponent Na+:H+ antiporter subunit D
MSELLVAAPVALPVVVAAACLLAWRSPAIQRTIAMLGLAALLVTSVSLVVAVATSGTQTLSLGGWVAPVGITFRADLLGALMTLVTAVVGMAVGVYALFDIPDAEARRGFWPLIVLLVMGVCGSFLTADMFNLFVWFEVMLISSFVLLALGREPRQLAGTHVYLVLNLIGSTLFLVTVGIIYGTTHTLDMRQLAERSHELAATEPGLVLAIHAMLLVAFGLKAAVVPAMFWLPASYHTPRPVISALFAALLTKVGVYAMIRVTADVLPPSVQVQIALGIVAMATMIVGVCGALAQPSVRRILSFHIISQIGYMVAGLALAFGTHAQRRFALAAAIFYVVHHILVKTNLFLVAGIIRHTHGTESLGRLGGVARSHPYLAVLFLISALSLAGVPPLSGFWAKLAVIRAGIDAGHTPLVVVAVLTGLLTLLSMLKIWFGAFSGDPADAPRPSGSRTPLLAMYAGATLLATGTVALSLWPELLFSLAFGAADQLGESGLVSMGGAR